MTEPMDELAKVLLPQGLAFIEDYYSKLDEDVTRLTAELNRLQDVRAAVGDLVRDFDQFMVHADQLLIISRHSSVVKVAHHPYKHPDRREAEYDKIKGVYKVYLRLRGSREAVSSLGPFDDEAVALATALDLVTSPQIHQGFVISLS